MNASKQPPEGFIWRKYQLGIPIYMSRPSGPMPEGGTYYLWPAIDEGNHADLNRWEGLEDAFLGFCSDGPVVECVCYDMQRALRALLDKGFYRTHNLGMDAAELIELFRENFVGVCFGTKTPCFFTVSADWEAEVALFLGSVQ